MSRYYSLETIRANTYDVTLAMVGKAGCAISIVDDSDRPKETDFCSFAERRTDE